MDREQARGIQAAVLAFTMWGLFTVYWKQLGHLDPFEMIGWRILSAAVIMTGFCAATGRLPDVRAALGDGPLRNRLIAAGILLIVNWTGYVWAVANDRVIETALGYFLAPLTTMLLGVYAFREQLTPLKRLAIASTAVAVVVLTVSYGAVPWIAVVIAASWSTYGVTKRMVPLGPFSSLTSELYLIVVPALAIVLLGFTRDTGIPNEAAGVDWLLLAGTGAITALPLTLFAFAAQRVPFTILGPTNFLVPVINFVLGWLIYDETMTLSRFIGFGFVWVALTLVTIDTIGRERRLVLTAG